jgi:hypothetical protein
MTLEEMNTREALSYLFMFADTNVIIHYLCMDILFMQIIDQMFIYTCSWIIMIISHSLNGLDIISVTMQLVCSHYVYTYDVADKGLGFMVLKWMIDRMRWWYLILALLTLAEKRREEEIVVAHLHTVLC